jgi:ribose transport system permease protein
VKKILGIGGLLALVCLLTASIASTFGTVGNIENLFQRSALFGIISIGAAFVIITGGIDLSIGSVICLVGSLLPWLLVKQGWSVGVALPFVLLLSVGIGLLHGLLITKLRLQPFIVTLCGLLCYRGITRGILNDQSYGFGMGFTDLRWLAIGTIPLGSFDLPMPFVILMVIALVASYVLNWTVYGRYLLALGRNEEAARFSGIETDRMTIGAYVACSFLAGAGGVLFVLDVNSAGPGDFGNFYELYAIAGAVLGGCALRGGEGTIVGVILGASLMQVLRNAIALIDWIPDQLEFAVIGVVILSGVVADELVKRLARRRRGR